MTEPTLEGLIEAWSSRPLAELAELVMLVSRRALAAKPIDTDQTSLTAAQAQWIGLAKQPSARERGWLVEHVVTSRGTLSIERLQGIARLPPDPRDVPALLGIAAAKPHSSREHRPFWTVLMRLLHARADTHVATTLEQLAARPAITDFDKYLGAKLRGLARRLRAAVVATADERAHLAALAAKLEILREHTAEKTAADFLREIWASPGDDGLRAVFADWLLERGDERGELISLQLARSRGTRDGIRRELALLAAHARRWMGPLEPVITSEFTFERGFLTTCKIGWRRLAAAPELMTHHAWSTVRVYKLDAAGERACDPWLDHMIALGAKRA